MRTRTNDVFLHIAPTFLTGVELRKLKIQLGNCEAGYRLRTCLSQCNRIRLRQTGMNLRAIEKGNADYSLDKAVDRVNILCKNIIGNGGHYGYDKRDR